MSKPSIGLALIARDAAETLPACLASVRPYVQQIAIGVDETTTDSTAAVARQHGADVVESIKVSDWHECERHGRVLAQDFAEARNQSFRLLDSSLDFWGWIDSDDVVEPPERLPEVCAALPADAVGLWLPYHYAQATGADGSKGTTTLFHRERLFRTRLGDRPVTWKWQYRVHEVCAPNVPARWAKTDLLRVVHQDKGHVTQSSAKRNLLLLEIDYEQNQDDPRTVFYLGNQYFAMGQWDAAAYWYERRCAMGERGPSYELWQAQLYLCKAYQRLQDPDNAIKAAFAALDTHPEHPEAYLALAEVYHLAGEPEKVIFWTKEGRRREEAPFFVFKNPLDSAYNSHLPLSDAYQELGRLSEARQELEQANATLPNADLQAAIERYRQTEIAAARATGFVATVDGHDDEAIVELWRLANLPTSVRKFGRCRDVAIPAIIRARPNTQPRVVFWCGRSLEPWAPPTLNETGIGGSETAVIHIADQFSRHGWRVDVYNDCDYLEGEYRSVGYWDCGRLLTGEVMDLFISWRFADPRIVPAPAGARRRVLWCHDLHSGPAAGPWLASGWDRILGVSAWHAAMLKNYYGLSETLVDFVPNGVDLDRFKDGVKKVPFRCIYASSPDRGLGLLLGLWPQISAHEPEAELHLAYGWDNVDRRVGMTGDQRLAKFKAQISALIEKTPRVVWRGRLPQDQLAQLYQESVAWLYPTDFLEVSCISAMEAMAGGCVPVCSGTGAVKETVGDGGYVLPGLVYSRPWQDFYCHIARAVISEHVTWKSKESAGRERAKSFTWERAFEKWSAMAEEFLVGNREIVRIA